MYQKSRMKTGDSKKETSIWWKNRCCQLTPDPHGKAALSLVTTALPFIIPLFGCRIGFVLFVFFFNNPVIIQMARSSFLVQMDPFGSTFRDWRSFSHLKLKLLKLRFCRRFCGNFLSFVAIPSDPRTVLLQELVRQV